MEDRNRDYLASMALTLSRQLIERGALRDDHACRECVGDNVMSVISDGKQVKPVFVCAYHRAERLRVQVESEPLSKVYVICGSDNCVGGALSPVAGNGFASENHHMMAFSDDGTLLAAHTCSSHEWARHDMGIDPNGLKRDVYASYYALGFEVVFATNAEDVAAIKSLAMARARYNAERLGVSLLDLLAR